MRMPSHSFARGKASLERVCVCVPGCSRCRCCCCRGGCSAPVQFVRFAITRWPLFSCQRLRFGRSLAIPSPPFPSVLFCSVLFFLAWSLAPTGAALGVGEVMLIPLDVLKIKSQTNPGALAGRSLWDILAKERLGSLYAGTSWTIARNVPGSALLFGCSALVRHRTARHRTAPLSAALLRSLANGKEGIAPTPR